MEEQALREIIAQVLLNARTDKGLSQEKLGNMADVDRSYISEIERAMRTPTIFTLFRIAKALEIEPKALVEQIQIQVNWSDESL